MTGIDGATIVGFERLDLADSALHVPAAAFGVTEFYPDFIDKAAVLVVRLAKNHPLPDGNKRSARGRLIDRRVLPGLRRVKGQDRPDEVRVAGSRVHRACRVLGQHSDKATVG